MSRIPSLDLLEQIRAFGEIKNTIDKSDNDFIKWVMRVGEARNILNNGVREFKIILDVMKELEHNMPHFHKQPANFKEFEARINNMIQVMNQVNEFLGYVKKEDKPQVLCDECGECLLKDKDDDCDECDNGDYDE